MASPGDLAGSAVITHRGSSGTDAILASGHCGPEICIHDRVAANRRYLVDSFFRLASLRLLIEQSTLGLLPALGLVCLVQLGCSGTPAAVVDLRSSDLVPDQSTSDTARPPADSSREAPRVDASRDVAALRERGAAEAGVVPTYPDCWNGKEKIYPCDATKACVVDCTSCPQMTINCGGGSAASDRKCVASCSACYLPDTCGNRCVKLATDVMNCGSCGRVCGSTAWGCFQAHCCAKGREWNADCGACCISSGGSGNCPPDVLKFCEPEAL